MQGSTIVEQKGSILTSFANTQLANVKPAFTKNNLLLELVVSAFFHGAVKKLDKQSDISFQESRHDLIDLIMATCSIPESSAVNILDSIDEMARQHGLIENVVQKGSDVAEQWLSCDTGGDGILHRLVEQYKGHAMHEYGIAGVSTRFEAQQKLLILNLDESVERVHRRTKFIITLLSVLGTCGLIVYYWYLYLR